MKHLLCVIIVIVVMMTSTPAGAGIPTVLTDRIRNGGGVIDLFKNVTGPELQQQLQDGTLYLGVDLNEDASGNESSTSSGVAIKEMEMIIKTNNGDISFTEFYSNSYKLRVSGQPPDISMYWYGAYSEGRHHSLVTCMRFRGIILENINEEKEVLTVNSTWMREFFIHDMKLISTFPEYLLAAFSPFSSPGVHIVVEAPSNLGPAYFASVSGRIVKQLHQTYVEQSRSNSK